MVLEVAKLLAVDPGDQTGMSMWTMDGTHLHRWICPAEEAIFALAGRNENNIRQIVCEDFRLFRHKAKQQSGSRFEAVQVIGALKLFSRTFDIPLSMQPPGILSVAQLHSGQVTPSNHKLSHDIDAYNHAYYWFETKGILKPVARP